MAFLFWLGIRGARNAVVRPNAFLRRKSAAFSACNAENTRKCNRHGGGAAAGVSRLSFHFPFSKISRISLVMRPDPDLTQTGVRRSGFIEIYLIKQHEYFLNDINQIPASGGQFMPTCGVLPMVFPVVLCYTERKDANAAETGRFSACTVSILQNGVSGWI
jgi:hypothetical protein